MSVTPPTPRQLREIADKVGLSLTDADVASFIALMAPSVDAYNVVARLPDNLPQVTYPRTPGYRPGPEENAHNAWYQKTRVEGARHGKLEGKTVVLKDNVMLAGVPMMNGAATLEGYVPDIDATVVTRILDAGGTILGKAHCENFCVSGGSHTNATGPVHNPFKMGYSAGGSSSGCAVLVALGEADMAIGGDQGGSIRMPASFSGIYGLKPTHGLVPYTGIMPIEITVDHTGPMTATVRDNALLLEVIAGTDGYDPRQYAPRVHPYTQMLDGGVRGMKLAIVREGFGQPGAEPDVDENVRASAARLGKLGATVEEVSIPWHLTAGSLFLPIVTEGLTQTMMWGDGYGVSRSDLYVTSLMDFHRGWRERADEMSETTKLFTLFGTYVRERYGSRYYGKAMNLSRQLTAAYDAVLASHDLLLMPTTPMKAQPLPQPGAAREEIVARALEMVGNTAPFDLSHHPAMAIPCCISDGLPVSMMLVGKHFDEPTIYRAAYAFEQTANWKTN
ncbi:MAG TPA: amidase [Candidatus Binatia bacterium]|nr:amidase [Candidatus Binatia bacterium]